MRNKFYDQLNELNCELIEMGKLCEEAIAAAVQAFLARSDVDELCRRAEEADRHIDRMEREIEALCLKLLLRQQPVAGDLRAISSALRIISDMERIGDQAADIAEIARHAKGRELKSRVHISDMAYASRKMVERSVDSFVQKDLCAVREVLRYDDVVDELFERIKVEIAELISRDGGTAEVCIDLLMTAKYLERIADHAENIAEWVEFFVTGKHPDDGVEP